MAKSGTGKHVQPTPESPQPAAKAVAVPITLLSNHAVTQTCAGTNAPPANPIARRMQYKPVTSVIVPARPQGKAEAMRMVTKTLRCVPALAPN